MFRDNPFGASIAQRPMMPQRTGQPVPPQQQQPQQNQMAPQPFGPGSQGFDMSSWNQASPQEQQQYMQGAQPYQEQMGGMQNQATQRQNTRPLDGIQPQGLPGQQPQPMPQDQAMAPAMRPQGLPGQQPQPMPQDQAMAPAMRPQGNQLSYTRPQQFGDYEQRMPPISGGLRPQRQPAQGFRGQNGMTSALMGNRRRF